MSPFHLAKDQVLSNLSTLLSTRREREKEILKAAKGKRGEELDGEELRMLIRDMETNKDTNKDRMEEFMVSLGDLGRKDIRHEPGDAGTSLSFSLAASFLSSFSLPYGVITGNHDLEGLDEFPTDSSNLDAFTSTFGVGAHLNSFSRPPSSPYWSADLGDSVLAVGLCTTRFRDAVHSSHEVYVDDHQLAWFEGIVRDHPDHRVLVFSHAPPLGAELRVLQDVHLRNGCAYINHSGDINRARKFIEIVKTNSNVKCWFSGHYHLSHDFPDSISTVGGCMFVQCGVMGPSSTRDLTRQTRVVDLDLDGPGFASVYTCNHHEDGELRLDAKFNLQTSQLERVGMTREPVGEDGLRTTYTPKESDGCYSKLSETTEGGDGGVLLDPADAVCWWHMECGRVLGYHDCTLLEYDPVTLGPLGIVKEGLEGKEIRVVNGGRVLVVMDKGDEGMDSLEVIQPNADGR